MLAPSGLRIVQFTMLGAVHLTGPATISDLAERLSLDRTTLTRNLKRLETKGFIEMKPGVDRRERFVTLSAVGEAAMSRALPLWRAAQDRVNDELGPDGWRDLTEKLDKLAQLEDSGFK